ncbi:MAG: hypothetical protein US60_C0006G0008 [Microgenomates group bacterium GW2011_GWC1_37_8]|uniref:Uncharacterized protein n=1 Tax=Candidatus Woesebacteria bacterium GW2011_GWB1_38_8 TaxID=1618570 RepID=A0A0G0P700_9BACT|nr:MAG: hypothetical protein US60_C0006G0008 [Microgenomates group bacterium GW2011_GWC1_37_8]KKQ85081.1 MAG: hypothetical protein UT08_C0010G0008 [Candidatus Woesebacteria bacterium GW2011_GWB1_38_8]
MNTRKLFMILLAIFMFLLIFLTGYNVGLKIRPKTQKTQVNSQKEDNIFDISTVKVEDEVAGMKVTEIGPFLDDTDIPLSENAKISFGGKAVVTGSYFFSGPMSAQSSEELDTVCMSDFTKESLEKIPKPASNNNSSWFCFTNKEFAFNQLGPVGSKGIATVLIDNYTINIYPSEVTNTAELLWVEK